MEEKFTIEEIKNYILSQNSLEDVICNLKAGNVKKVNQRESDNDVILIENGKMFKGSRLQFKNCFFYNATNEQIYDWCNENGWSLKINDQYLDFGD